MSLICLVTAMTAEARPLIEAFNLKPLPQKGLSAWLGDDVCLVQTGMGPQRAEARIDALLAVQLGINAFINVGIAGGKKDLGEVIIASSVKDQLSGKIWYPHLPPKSLLSPAFANDAEAGSTATGHFSPEACAVVSVPEPCANYKPDCVYDMEAAAVTQTVLKHTDLSRIHTVKVISDNPDNPLDDFSVKNVTPWMCNTIPTLEALMGWLKNDEATLCVEEFNAQISTMVNHITGVCHHSVTETHQLRRYLERFLALNGQLPTLHELGQIDSSKKILKRLENELADHSVNY